jgi:hypothetical protein
MIIAQTKSLKRTLDTLGNKKVKLFLFTSIMPVNQASIPFDTQSPLEVFAASVAQEETDLTTTVDGGIVLKANPDLNGIEFKGSGPDISRSGTFNWLIPTSIETNLVLPEDDKFDFLRILQQPGTNSANKYLYESNFVADDYIQFNFDYGVDVDGFDFEGSASNTHSDFKVQYWDPTLFAGVGDWVDHVTQVADSVSYRLDFVSVSTTKMRIIFLGTSVSEGQIVHARFFSSDTAPATNFGTLDPASWAMMFLDIKGSTVESFLGTVHPYIWFPVGDPLAPNVATFTSIDIAPATLTKLIHAEFIGNLVEDI